MNNKNSNREPLTPEQEKNISDRFKFLWEQYIKVVNLTISLSLGTLLVFANSFFVNDNYNKLKEIPSSEKWIAILAILFIFGGLIVAIIWRVLSQVYMEKEVFGKSEVVKQYLEEAGIYDHSYSFEEKQSKIKRLIWFHSQYVGSFMLFLGWICFLLFFFLHSFSA